MSLLIAVFTSLAAAFLFHVGLWRVHFPKNETKTLGLIFLIFLAAALITLHLQLGFSLISLVHFSLFYLSAAAVYLLTYTGLQAPGPSFTMLLMLEKAGDSGLEMSDFARKITNKDFIDYRLDELINGGSVESKNGRLFVTSKGLKYMTVFTLYKRLLGIQSLGG